MARFTTMQGLVFHEERGNFGRRRFGVAQRCANHPGPPNLPESASRRTSCAVRSVGRSFRREQRERGVRRRGGEVGTRDRETAVFSYGSIEKSHSAAGTRRRDPVVGWMTADRISGGAGTRALRSQRGEDAAHQWRSGSGEAAVMEDELALRHVLGGRQFRGGLLRHPLLGISR
ncbi:hypothetical protein CBR_g39565 [Chara braunii]|uniref:Uncharacterized protein n=1 Tax=Chara braunii TaxID=69332 RepID=A0A388LRZ4_CHABU|nr:hypothetical protein CBR_g39565 [Chara braunii]|eukprot:GBG85106.1 hypothetical protein CBR_g39565 [Chara braunii]